MSTRYHLTAAAVTNIPAGMHPLGGATLIILYRGQILPDGVPEKKIRHLLDAGMIAPFEE
jgi:hypothetical protein